jgi:8-oxo-dGTP pyrophosphatase MutT (NUDIX family)
MEEFELLAQGIFTDDAVDVDYRPGVRIRWEQSAGKFIDKVWEAYIRTSSDSGISVYNGKVFRLDSFAWVDGRLSLTLSDIDFRSCIGSGTNQFAAAFPHAPQANPLSVSVALVTIDGRIVLEKRSRIDARRRKYHVIAGFMERDVDALDTQPNPFDTLRREVREELGLILECPLYGTGLVRAVYGSEICFYCRLPVSFERLLEIKANSETDCEIDALETIDDSPTAVASFLVRHATDFVPSGRACLLLYGRQAYGEHWYDGIANLPSV